MKNSIKVLLAVVLSGLMMVSACGSAGQPSYLVPTTHSEEENSTEAPTSAPASESAESVDTSEAVTSGSQDGSESASESESAPVVTEPAGVFDFTPDQYSYGYTDEGYIEGVNALEYVELPDFSHVNIKKSKIEPTETDIATYLYMFLSEYMIEDRESVVKDGDTLNIDYVGYVDGEAFAGGDTQGKGTAVTIGVTSYIDDFLEQLIGHKPGETFDVNVTFPDPYQNNPALAGKDAVFVTTINYISVAPEFDEKFISEHQEEVDSVFGGDIKTQDDAKQRVRDYYYDTNLMKAIEEVLQDSMDGFDAPEKAIETARNQMDINTQLYYGMNLISFGSAYGYSETQMDTMIENQAKALMVHQAVAEQNNWHYTEEDLREEFGDKYQEFVDIYGKGYLAEYMLSQKASQYMKETVKIVDDSETK